MTFFHLASLMESWGFKVKPEHYGKFELYLNKMLKANQVIIVKDEGQILAILTFFTTNNYDELYKKSTWEFIKSNPFGTQLYIDKMVCRKWTKSVRKEIQLAIQETFPQVAEAFYHRAPKDRCVKINRQERFDVIQSTVS